MNSIREQLIELAEEDYRKFTASLLPGVENILGVRLPLLRYIAKKIAKEDWRTFLATKDDIYMEEITLRGMVIGYVKADIGEILHYAAEFIPHINNWSTCDSFCGGLKITKTNKERVWDFLQPYLTSDKEYEIRFGVVMLLNYYVTPEYTKRAFQHFDTITHKGYYVMMAVAWAISIYYISLPDITLEYLRNNRLDDVTYHKALQKITESLRIDKETKEMIRGMKRK
ncbi:MAG: alkylation repair protein [Anaerocolumna sp.]|jgi:3-methyladenine DNA glycosylase AlkD|nr:alkylation repair protein [Anaerocolumna sp.]